MKVPATHVATSSASCARRPRQKISGQLFGVRGREVFLFSQPRPVARMAKADGDWTSEALADAVERELAPHFTELSTDLEAFNTEPVV